MCYFCFVSKNYEKQKIRDKYFYLNIVRLRDKTPTKNSDPPGWGMKHWADTLSFRKDCYNVTSNIL